MEIFQLIQHKNRRKIKYIWTMFLADLNQYKSKEQYKFIILESLLHGILRVRLDWHSSQIHSLLFFSSSFFLSLKYQLFLSTFSKFTSFSKGEFYLPPKVLWWFCDDFSQILLSHCKDIKSIWRCLYRSKELFGEKVSSCTYFSK